MRPPSVTDVLVIRMHVCLGGGGRRSVGHIGYPGRRHYDPGSLRPFQCSELDVLYAHVDDEESGQDAGIGVKSPNALNT